MTKTQALELKLGEARRKLAEAIATEAPDMETVNALTAEVRQTDDLLIAAKLVEPEPVETRESASGETAEQRELAELQGKVEFRNYINAALHGLPVIGGPELELNQHLGLDPGYFPLDVMGAHLEQRALRDGDAQGNQATWLDRVFAETASARLGITMPTVPAGVAAYPTMTAGGAGAQRGRTQAAVDSTYTFAVTEIKPTRHAVHGIYSIEDELRLPGMASAIERDMAMATVESIDRAIFSTDAGANEDTADITGLRTHADVGESTITQNNKIKGDELLKLFLAFVDGKYAATMADVRVVASVGSTVLWGGTVHNSAVDNETVAAFLRANGVTWTTREGIDTATSNNDFGAYIGLARGVDGAGVAPIWNKAQIVRDGWVQTLTSRFSYGFPIFWVQLPLLLPLRLFPASVPDIPPFETASVHAPLISPIFFGDFVICGCSLGTTKKAAMECPSPPLL